VQQDKGWLHKRTSWFVDGGYLFSSELLALSAQLLQGVPASFLFFSHSSFSPPAESNVNRVSTSPAAAAQHVPPIDSRSPRFVYAGARGLKQDGFMAFSRPTQKEEEIQFSTSISFSS
jgi:hypothetical protein